MDTLLSAFYCGRTESFFGSGSSEEDDQRIHELEVLLRAFQQAYEELRLAFEATREELLLYKQTFGSLDSVQADVVRTLRAEISDLKLALECTRKQSPKSPALTSQQEPMAALAQALQQASKLSARQDSCGSPGDLVKSALKPLPELVPSNGNGDTPPASPTLASPRRARKGRTVSWSRQIRLEGASEDRSSSLPHSDTSLSSVSENLYNAGEMVTVQACEHGNASRRAPHEIENITRALKNIQGQAKDEMLCSLSDFQLQCIRDHAQICVFRDGEVLIHKGTKAAAALHVLLSGSVQDRELDCISVLPAYSFVGHGSLMFGEALTTIAAVEDVDTLMLSKGLLECMFGQRLNEVLLRSFIYAALARHDVFKSLRAEELKAAADLCEYIKLSPDEELDVANLRFALCMFGEVATSTCNNGGVKRVPKGSMVEFGEECSDSAHRQWTRQVRATSNAPALLGVWRGKDLADLFEQARASTGAEEKNVPPPGHQCEQIDTRSVQDPSESRLDDSGVHSEAT